MHLADEAGRFAQVDVKTRDDDGDDPDNAPNVPLIRFVHSNLVGSATLELDDTGAPVSYEEFHPFGTTSYRSARAGYNLSLKRFRFGAKERDDETGLYYCGARYYAAWLGRWVSSDPAGFIDGCQLYSYCSNNPISMADPSGTNGIAVSGKPPEIRQAQRTHTEEAGQRYEGWLRSQTLEHDGQQYQIQGGTRVWNEAAGGHWWIPDAQMVPVGTASQDQAEIEVTATPPEQTAEGPGGSAGATAAGQRAVTASPEGFTLEVPNNFDDEAIGTYRDRIQTDRGVGNRSAVPGERRSPRGSDVTDQLRHDNRGLVRNYERSLPNGRPPGQQIDHTPQLQHIIRGSGTGGADTVRPQDHRLQPAGVNASQGSSARATRERSVAGGAPEDVPAGGVARTSEIGLLRNSPNVRTGLRWGGYGLMGSGPALTAYGASQTDNPYVAGGAYGAAAVEAGGVGYYFYGRFAQGGANGFAAGRATMQIGGRVALGAGGVGQGLLSGYMVYQDYRAGDWTALAFDAAAAGGGIALIAAAIVTAPAWATGLAIFGLVTGIAAGVFHAGRAFGWWN